PYFAWRDPLRQLLGLNWEDPDSLALERLQAHLESSDAELLPWMPLLAIAFGAEAPFTREVEELAPEFRMARLHEVVLQFLAPALAEPTLLLIEHAQLMDEASAALLNALAARLDRSSWVVIATRRDARGGFVGTHPAIVRLELGPLTRDATL